MLGLHPMLYKEILCIYRHTVMNIREFIPGVFYVGVNDRTTTRFEGLWPLPNGVSYNSYLVKGSDKCALIDSVEIGSARDFTNLVDLTLKESKLDYLVVNHMEPDHSGSIPYLLSRFPDLKIVGNRQTLAMLKGFYGIDNAENLLEIKDGDSLSLGDRTLRFYLTPMVHWPETMMTYLVEEQVLFSGDAFGCFGALNGAVLDSNMDTECYFPEMYRYYSNIVGKYGKFVLSALNKLEGLSLSYICSTHGPVWHERLGHVVELYRKLAAGEGEDGVVIVYGSMYGNTASLAERMASELSKRGVRTIKIYNASFSEMSYMISDAYRYRGLIVASPTYSMTLFPPVKTFMDAMVTRGVKDKVFASLSSFTWASAAAKSLAEYAATLGWPMVGAHDMKQGGDETTSDAVASLADAFIEAYKK